MKKKRKKMRSSIAGISWIIIILLGFTGCSKGKFFSDYKTTPLSNQTQKLTQEDGKNQDNGGIRGNFQTTSISDEFKQAYTEFSLKLLLESKQSGENLNTMVSPLSVLTALEMTRNGAAGETLQEMNETMYGAMDAEEGKKQLMAYLHQLPNQEKARFHFANSIWFRTGDTRFVPSESFLQESAADYQAEIYEAPFDEGTLKDINQWVENETMGMIPNILNKISPEAMMYLINAVAFEAEWEKIYREDQVHDREFMAEDGSVQLVPMMYQDEGILLKDETATGFLKPYAKGYAFMALLPEKEGNLDAYLQELTGEALCRLLATAQEASVVTGIPKFKAETFVELKDSLDSMGMPLAFDGKNADFSGIGRYQGGNLYIDRVLHKTYIEVNESGTRAGAATAVEICAEGAMESEMVILNRPFVYAIIDLESRLPVFIGVMEKPE